jgi:hypothetical protein
MEALPRLAVVFGPGLSLVEWRTSSKSQIYGPASTLVAMCSGHSSWRAEDKFVIYLRPSWGRGATEIEDVLCCRRVTDCSARQQLSRRGIAACGIVRHPWCGAGTGPTCRGGCRLVGG